MTLSKAYQALTDPVARENYEKYGHPDGRQVCSILIYETGHEGVAKFVIADHFSADSSHKLLNS